MKNKNKIGIPSNNSMNFSTSSNLASVVVKSIITLFEYVGPSNIMALPSG